MSDISDDDLVITPSDGAVLEHRRLITPTMHGRRVISRSMMYSEASEYSASSSGSDSGYAASEPPSVEIPAQFHSIETLVFLGFTEDRAARIWQRWEERGDLPDEFLEFAQYAISYNPGDVSDNDDQAWVACFESLGINGATIYSIMDSTFAAIRLRESCQYWVLDTMKSRYESLEAIHKASRAREQRILTSSSERLPSGSSGNTNLSTEDTPGALVATQSASRRSTAPGHTTLWKGCSEGRALATKRALETGKLEFGDMISYPPTDFNVAGSSLYFAVQKEVAKLYAGYSKRRNDIGRPVIVRLDIPNSFIENLQPHQITYGDTWKEYVWTCRRGSGAIMPKELRHLGSKNLLIGPICRTHTKGINKMPKWSDITIANVMTEEDDRGEMEQATQYVFRRTDEMLEHMQDPANGIKIELTFYNTGVSQVTVSRHEILI